MIFKTEQGSKLVNCRNGFTCFADMLCAAKESGIELPSNNEEMNEAAAYIELKLNDNINVATRSTGVVGDTVGTGNVWNNQLLNVFMFEKGTLKLAQEEFSFETQKNGETVDSLTKRAIFDDAKVIAPKGADGAADYGYEAKYYPATGAYDFFAYYDDDAAGDVHVFDSATNKTQMTLAIEINGAQDLMVAKAIPSSSDSAVYTAPTNENKGARFYSAYTARRGVQPSFTFEHLLTRFVFNVSSDSAKYCDATTGITIDSIAIVNLPYKGKMTVAYTGAKPTNMLAWDAAKDTLWLQQRYENNVAKKDTVCKLLSVTPKWNDPETEGTELERIGESLLVPTQTSYDLVIYYSQRPNASAGTQPAGWDESVNGTWENYKNRVYNSVYTKTITPANNKPGTQYNVFFTVVGLEKIELDVKLTAWENGEDVNIDNDEW